MTTKVTVTLKLWGSWTPNRRTNRTKIGRAMNSCMRISLDVTFILKMTRFIKLLSRIQTTSRTINLQKQTLQNFRTYFKKHKKKLQIQKKIKKKYKPVKNLQIDQQLVAELHVLQQEQEEEFYSKEHEHSELWQSSVVDSVQANVQIHFQSAK